MPNVKSITIERTSQYGVLCQNVWYNMSKNSNLKPSDFVIGGQYEVDLWTSPNGKMYINSVVGEKSSAPMSVPTSPVPVAQAASVPKPTSVDPSYQVAQDKKSKQIQAQGTIQAAVQAPCLQMFSANYEEWINLVVQTAERQLKFIQEHS